MGTTRNLRQLYYTTESPGWKAVLKIFWKKTEIFKGETEKAQAGSYDLTRNRCLSAAMSERGLDIWTK